MAQKNSKRKQPTRKRAIGAPTRTTTARSISRRSPQRERAAIPQLGEQLVMLESSGLIQLIQTHPELAYLFRHTLVQEATYLTLVKQDRKRLHLVVGEALEQLYANRLEELSPLLANHFYEAADHARALKYFTQAGDHAARKYANAEAIMHYSRALELITSGSMDSAQLIHLYSAYGRALEMSGQYDAALANYQVMEGLARERGDRALELAALLARATVHSAPTAHFDAAEAQALLGEALQLARELGDRAAEAKVFWNLALVSKFRGQWSQVAEYGEQSAAIARELNLREQLAYTLNDTFVAYMSIGQAQRAREILDEAQRIWRELGNAPMLADNLANAAELEYTTGNVERALAHANEAYRIGLSIGNLWNQSYSLMTKGQALVERGDIAEGITALEQAVELGQRAGFAISQLYGYGLLGLAYGSLGDSEHGIAAARRALNAAEEMFPGWKTIPMAMLAMLLVWNHQIGEAESLVQQAHVARNPDDMQSLMILSIAEGELGLAKGEYERVLTIMENYSTMLESAGIRAYWGVMLHTKGEALMGLGRWAEAQQALEAARAAEESLGARRILWRILWRLSELKAREGDVEAAQQLRRQAREVVEYIAAHISSPDLRESFLSLPDARAILQAV